MAYTSISAILRSEAFEDFIEDFIDDYGMGFISELDPDKDVYPMEELDDILHGMAPMDILRMGVFGDIVWTDEYFTFDGYGNIQTISEYNLHNYLWDCIRYDTDKFHEYLMDYYPDYEEKFNQEFPVLESVELFTAERCYELAYEAGVVLVDNKGNTYNYEYNNETDMIVPAGEPITLVA